MGYGRTNIAGGGLRIKSSQSGTWNAGSSSWEDIKINEVDLTSSIIILTVEPKNIRNSSSHFTAHFKSSTLIRIQREYTSIEAVVHWTVYELVGFKSLQFVTGTIERNNSAGEYRTTIQIPITKVNPEKTLLFTTLRFYDPNKYELLGGWMRLSDATHIELGNATTLYTSVWGNTFVVELK